MWATHSFVCKYRNIRIYRHFCISDKDERRTSTPIQGIQEEGSVKSPAQGKHTLTPSSKQAPLPPLKKACVGKLNSFMYSKINSLFEQTLL